MAKAKGLVAVSILFLLLGFLAGYFIRTGTPATTTTIFTTLTSEKEVTTTLTTTQALSGSVTLVSTTTKTLTTIQLVTKLQPTTLTKYTTISVQKIAEGGVETVCFPRAMGGCANLLIGLINSANESIHVMIYSFTLDQLADGLIKAKLRGVDVKVLVEKGRAYERGSEVPRLVKAGVEVALDSNPASMHNKVMIIDGKITVTGSYNWSWSAENKNDENLIVILNPEVARLYEAEFKSLWSYAERL